MLLMLQVAVAEPLPVVESQLPDQVAVDPVFAFAASATDASVAEPVFAAG
jgi:hypothetical protein